MPATRSSSRVQSKATVSSTRNRNHLSASSDDVIIISSDEEDLNSTAYALKRAQQEIRQLKKKLVAKQSSSGQVLSDQGNHPAEILPSAIPNKSDEERLRLEAQLQQASTDIHKLQKALRLEKTQKVNDASLLKKRVQKAEKDIGRLRALNQKLHDKTVLLNEELHKSTGRNSDNNALKDLENQVLCEVCVEKLWQPYTLSGCGHTFCRGCLIDWFNTAISANAYNPQYSCPTCRAQVRQAPVEVYTLKRIVRTISHAIDPTNRSPPASPRNYHGRGPWYRFFG